MLKLAAQAVCNQVEIEEWPAAPFISSRPVRADVLAGNHTAVGQVIMEHIRYMLKHQLQAGFPFGAMVDCRNFMDEGTEDVVFSFFSRTTQKRCEAAGVPYQMRPAGSYAVTYFKGDYMDTTAAYERLRQYFKTHPDCRPGKYSYEESILEKLSTADEQDFITRIAVPIFYML